MWLLRSANCRSAKGAFCSHWIEPSERLDVRVCVCVYIDMCVFLKGSRAYKEAKRITMMLGPQTQNERQRLQASPDLCFCRCKVILGRQRSQATPPFWSYRETKRKTTMLKSTRPLHHPTQEFNPNVYRPKGHVLSFHNDSNA